MFNFITWGQYFTIILVLSIFYYSIISFCYYRDEILNLIGIKKVEKTSSDTIPLSSVNYLNRTEGHSDYLPQQPLEFDISPLIQSFTDEVHAYVQEACQNSIEKNELLNSLQKIVLKYPVLKKADFKNDLTDIIMTAFSNQYHNLQTKDLIQIWK